METVASGSSASTFIPTTRIFSPIVDAHPHVSRPRTRPDRSLPLPLPLCLRALPLKLAPPAWPLLPIRIEEPTASPHRPLPMALSPNPLGRPQISTETSQSDKRDPADTARSGQDGITSDTQAPSTGKVFFGIPETHLPHEREKCNRMTKMMLLAEADLQKALKAWTSAYGSIKKSRSHTAIHLLSLVRDESSSHICPQSLSCEACAVTQPLARTPSQSTPAARRSTASILISQRSITDVAVKDQSRTETRAPGCK